MLSDRERQALSEMESQFRAEDPKLSHSFDPRAQRQGGTFRRVLAVAAIIPVAMMVALVLLVTGSVGAVLGLAAVAGVMWGCWLSNKNAQDEHDPHR